jgi:hypothetical protein
MIGYMKTVAAVVAAVGWNVSFPAEPVPAVYPLLPKNQSRSRFCCYHTGTSFHHYRLATKKTFPRGFGSKVTTLLSRKRKISSLAESELDPEIRIRMRIQEG